MKKKHLNPILCAAFTAALSSSTLQAAVVAQFSFENNLNDSASVGTADNLSYIQGASTSGSAQYVAGVPGLGGSAALFDGNYFTAPDSNDLDITTDWTIETFISISTPNALWERTVVKWGGASTDYHFALRSGSLDLVNSSGGNPVATVNTAPVTNFADGDWHHIAITSSASGAEAWIDGTSVWTGGAITLVAGTDPLGLGDFGIGMSPNNDLRLHGKLDEVRIHNAPVNQAYIDGRAALLVPEPSTSLFFGLAGFALVLRRRR